MKKVLRLVSYSVVLTALLCLYSFGIVHVERGGTRFGVLSEPIKSFYEFPKFAYAVLRSNELWGHPLDYRDRDESFSEINDLSYDLYSLHGSFDNSNARWNIRLFNLKNDSTYHTWQIRREHYDYEGNPIEFFNTDLKNIVLLPDRSIVLRFNKTNGVVRLDKQSRLIWKINDRFHHHSINQDSDGNLWVPARTQRPIKSASGKIFYYREEYLSKYDLNTGELLFNKSISDIFKENNLQYLIYGLANHINHYDNPDPFHLNDIQPALSDTDHWKKGDLFLSFRHRSLLMLYRPSTNEIIKLIQGPFSHQHDVDIYSDHEISFFNNNAISLGTKKQLMEFGPPENQKDSLISSEVLIYNFETNEFSSPYKPLFEQEKIYTRTNGLHQFLSNGDVFVESFEEGKLFILEGNKVVYKNQLDTPEEDMIYIPNWMQLYEDINF